MIYIEIQLSGQVLVYDLPDHLVMVRATIMAQAECLPTPESMAEAHDYMRAGCHQMEIFESLAHAEDWAESYSGFRAGEVRAGLTRFQIRRAAYAAATVAAGAS